MAEPGRLILVADDDSAVRALLRDYLEEKGYRIAEAESGRDVTEQLTSTRPDLLLLDMRMPGASGMEILEWIGDRHLGVPAIIMTAYGTSSGAIKAIQLGAYDYITKPFDLDEVLVTIRRFFQYQELASEVQQLRSQRGEEPEKSIVGRSAAMLDVYKTIGKVARTDATVLVMGETGTGKELVAEVLHTNSPRRLGPLIKVACASLPESLLESELFGHEKGAFTSAISQRKGRFELAHKGTIFLDEIGEMSLGTQKKLLRVLQEREFERVGGSTPIHIDTRVVAATNKDLEAETAKGTFRADLFYRLNVIALRMPPLRERKDDVPLLIEHFLHKHRFTPGSPPAKMSEDALSSLLRHDWPGNVRELENTIERAVVLAQGDVITSAHLLLSKASVERKFVDIEEKVRLHVPMKEVLAEVEKGLIVEALHQAEGNRSQAAKLLGIYRRLLYAKLKEHEIPELTRSRLCPKRLVLAVLPLVYHPDPRLRVKCHRVTRFDRSLTRLVDDMLETLEARDGLGLAAPQVGVPLRLFVAYLPEDCGDAHAGETFVLVNPEIVKSSGEQEVWDSCLSLPGWAARAKRAAAVTVKARDQHSREVRLKADGLLAHCLQHEIDHLDGVLYINRIEPSELRRLESLRVPAST